MHVWHKLAAHELGCMKFAGHVSVVDGVLGPGLCGPARRLGTAGAGARGAHSTWPGAFVASVRMPFCVRVAASQSAPTPGCEAQLLRGSCSSGLTWSESCGSCSQCRNHGGDWGAGVGASGAGHGGAGGDAGDTVGVSPSVQAAHAGLVPCATVAPAPLAGPHGAGLRRVPSRRPRRSPQPGARLSS